MTTAEAKTGGEDDEAELKAGLEPVEFQRRLVFVTFTVLFLGITGGTCLGWKIQKAENYQAEHAQSAKAIERE
ncbi:MAG: hypothetical protein ABEL76_03270 [Bradymonadaceae bacterium]